jgi:hypothetical protein
MTATVHFWFDPTCPFTWATSCWLRETAPAQDAQVEWQLMSLAVLNDGQPVPERVRSHMALSWRALRMLAAVERKDGSPAVGALFTALGARLHEQGRGIDDAVLAESRQPPTGAGARRHRQRQPGPRVRRRPGLVRPGGVTGPDRPGGDRAVARARGAQQGPAVQRAQARPGAPARLTPGRSLSAGAAAARRPLRR